MYNFSVQLSLTFLNHGGFQTINNALYTNNSFLRKIGITHTLTDHN